MNKLYNKIKPAVVFLLVAFVLLTIAFILVYKQKISWQNRVGEYNISNWYHLETMARNIDNQGYTVDTLKTHYKDANAVIYTCTHRLMPPLNGDGKAHSFMGGYYAPLIETLISGNLSEEKQKEGLLIFETMNKEFISLCDEVTGEANNRTAKKAELVDSKSDLYISLEKKSVEFCNKYSEQISRFNYNAGVSSYIIKNVDKEFNGDGISVYVQYFADYYEKTRVDCIIKTEKDENPLIHLKSKIKGVNGEYNYIEGTGYTKGGQTQYTLYFDSIGNERNVELYIELKSGEKITVPLNLK